MHVSMRSIVCASVRVAAGSGCAAKNVLTDSRDRAAYVRQVARSVTIGGHVIVATFGPEGPAQCSGLDVVRYGPEALHAEFGPHFRVQSRHALYLGAFLRRALV